MTTTLKPPKWAVKVAAEIKKGESRDIGLLTSEAARIVASYAPDAESLALSLEECIMLLEQKGVTPLEAIDALRDYRAAHPKGS